ncbi:2-oxo-4-hydroxy-4-carboxy-5-ureidoimidazoline decarboxylase [Streptomyces sp. NPDC046985]|uniref:2-oxo-4-hydroxy-4-carboxy-5-ureidoimidazoline decarboxylase n=1 Tax=Streptomyces sp. NPDC046985 TaxID=3155377 RepID=UPI0033DA1D7F
MTTAANVTVTPLTASAADAHGPSTTGAAASHRRGPTLPEQSLEHFNAAPPEAARRILLTCLRGPRWAHRVAAHRPYPDLAALLAAADEAAYDLGPGELTEALETEPPPVLPEDAYAAASTALDAAYAAYEARFGHAFALCLEDVSPDEAVDRLLAAIRSRLANDPEEERTVAAEELRRLARARLRRLLGDAGSPVRAPLSAS